MNGWHIVGWTLLGIGYAFLLASLGFMIWALIDMGYYWGAFFTLAFCTLFIVDQVYPYKDLPPPW